MHNNITVEITETHPRFGTKRYIDTDAEYDLLVQARNKIDSIIQLREEEAALAP